MNLSKIALLVASSLSLASVGCSAAAEDQTESTTEEESALTSGAGRIVKSGDWKLNRVRFHSESSETVSQSDEGSGRVVFSFDDAQPTLADINQTDGFLFTPVHVTFRAPAVAGGGTRKIAVDAMCNQTLLTSRPGWQSGVECRLTNEKDQRGESWIVRVVYDADGAIENFELGAQHRPTFDQMIAFIAR